MDSHVIDHFDWSKTLLGETSKWSHCLSSLTTMLAALPYEACIFWTDELVAIQNSRWVSLAGGLKGQGGVAEELYGPSVSHSLRMALNGHNVSLDPRQFFNQSSIPRASRRVNLRSLKGDGKAGSGVLAILSGDDVPSGHSRTPSFGVPDDQSELAELNRLPIALTIADQVDDRGEISFEQFACMLPVGMAILKTNGQEIFVNDMFHELTLYAGKSNFLDWIRSIDSDDRELVTEEYQKAIASHKMINLQFRSHQAFDPEASAWRSLVVSPIMNKDCKNIGFLCVMTDITASKIADLYRKRVVAEAAERKKQQEKFMDMISHEIRNPLSAILQCSELVLESLNADSVDATVAEPIAAKLVMDNFDPNRLPDVLDAARTISTCVRRQRDILEDVLSFSKLDAMMLPLTPSPFQPKQNVAEYLRKFSPELKPKDIGIDFFVDTSYQEQRIDWVKADMIRINQVLTKLVRNAIKYTGIKQGERQVTVSIGASTERPTSYPPSIVYFNEKNREKLDATLGPEWSGGRITYLLVAVKDTGIGISSEAQAELFERFKHSTPKTQGEYSGKGLGLFISRKICQLHGGDIGVASRENEGSTFSFFFKVRALQSADQEHVQRREVELQATSIDPVSPEVTETTPATLINPPVEKRAEVSPECSSDSRYERTASIANAVADDKKNQASSSDQNDPTDLQQNSKPPQNRSLDVSSEDGESGKLDQGTTEANLTLEPDRPGEDLSPALGRRSTHEQTAGKTDAPQRADLPATNAPGPTDATKSKTDPQASRPCLLLVEDNMINQKLLKRQLESKGFSVTAANNGQIAVDIHNSFLESVIPEVQRGGLTSTTLLGKIECILMDQEMPVMDGNTATTIIRKREQVAWGANAETWRTPILGISANARDVQKEGMIQAGMDDAISKPFSLLVVVKRIHELIAQRRQKLESDTTQL